MIGLPSFRITWISSFSVLFFNFIETVSTASLYVTFDFELISFIPLYFKISSITTSGPFLMIYLPSFRIAQICFFSFRVAPFNFIEILSTASLDMILDLEFSCFIPLYSTSKKYNSIGSFSFQYISRIWNKVNVSVSLMKLHSFFVNIENSRFFLFSRVLLLPSNWNLTNNEKYVSQ